MVRHSIESRYFLDHLIIEDLIYRNIVLVAVQMDREAGLGPRGVSSQDNRVTMWRKLRFRKQTCNIKQIRDYSREIF